MHRYIFTHYKTLQISSQHGVHRCLALGSWFFNDRSSQGNSFRRSCYRNAKIYWEGVTDLDMHKYKCTRSIPIDLKILELHVENLCQKLQRVLKRRQIDSKTLWIGNPANKETQSSVGNSGFRSQTNLTETGVFFVQCMEMHVRLRSRPPRPVFSI